MYTTLLKLLALYAVTQGEAKRAQREKAALQEQITQVYFRLLSLSIHNTNITLYMYATLFKLLAFYTILLTLLSLHYSHYSHYSHFSPVRLPRIVGS